MYAAFLAYRAHHLPICKGFLGALEDEQAPADDAPRISLRHGLPQFSYHLLWPVYAPGHSSPSFLPATLRSELSKNSGCRSLVVAMSKVRRSAAGIGLPCLMAAALMTGCDTDGAKPQRNVGDGVCVTMQTRCHTPCV